MATRSTISGDSAVLQKLGFGTAISDMKVFASILNRLRSPIIAITYILEVISYIQIISIGFYSNINGLLDGNQYTEFLHDFFQFCIDIPSLSNDKTTAHVICLIIYAVLMLLWVLLYFGFTIKYKKTKTYDTGLIYSIYIIGYHIIDVLLVLISTTIGYFLRPLFIGSYEKGGPETNAIPTFISVILLFGYAVIKFFMIQVMQSSPDVDIKNKLVFWPQNYFQVLYRGAINLVLPMVLELLRGNGEIAEDFGYIINIIAGIGGIVLIWFEEANVYVKGKVVITAEYIILLSSSLLSLIYVYTKDHVYSLIYLLIFIIIVIVSSFIISFISEKIMKRKIDDLYLPIDDLTNKINSPSQCINYIKIGLLYNAPCIENHTFLNWAISKWPNDQDLLLMISFAFFILHMPYKEILDLVSAAIDISPFNSYDGLFFYQIFNRLPTHEHLLLRKIEGIKRLYELPKSSLRNFWEAVLSKQWDEAIVTTKTFKKDLDALNKIFSHLIFENPSSECVMQEFIKYALEIQGNYNLAYSAQRELSMREAINNNAYESYANSNPNPNFKSNQGNNQKENQESIAVSKLSTVKSSLFLSDFSENMQVADRIHNGVQEAIFARPLYGPSYFLTGAILLSTISLITVVTAYIIVRIESDKIDTQISFACRIQECTLTLTQILCDAFDFTTHDESPENTVSNSIFNSSFYKTKMNEYTNTFDMLIVEAFKHHYSFPNSFLETWVSHTVSTTLISPNEGIMKNISLLDALRLYQFRARTLAFSPDSYIGSIQNPSPEIIQIAYLYPAAMEVTVIILREISNNSAEEFDGTTDKILISIAVCVGVNFLLLILFIPLVVYGTMREYDFLVTLYSSIPTKTVKKIITSDNPNYHYSLNKNTHEVNQRSKIRFNLPNKLYHVGSIIAMLFMVFLIPPIPVIPIALSFVNHLNQNEFITHGILLSSEMIKSFGTICLHSFQLISNFTTKLSDEQEIQSIVDSANEMLNKYNEVFFGGTSFYETGLVTQDSESSGEENQEQCFQILGGGVINHNCTQPHTDIYYIYGLCKRLQEIFLAGQIDNLKTEGVSTNWWVLFNRAAESGLERGISSFFESYDSIAREQENTNFINSLISLIASIILFILAILISSLFSKFILLSSIKALLKPMVLMNPEYISDSPVILRFLQGDYDNPQRQTSRQSRKSKSDNVPIIDYILEGVLVITADGTIISSNKKFHELFQNTAEEILGLNINNILPTSCQPLFDMLRKLRSGGVIQNNISVETTLFTEDDRELQVKISLCINLKPNQRGNRSTICGVLFTDKSALIKAQNQLHEEKAKVESLLDSILPPSIARSLLNGQTDISFEVEMASILFSDIVSFTPMCSTMTAKQIMSTLNCLFTEFDTELAKYRRVTKLKTIGDAYVCAAGIFEGDDPLDEATKEMAIFATKMQEIIPDVNKKLGTNIHMRIGIFTGGPLICGVLGKDKPLFEIIGQPVNLAEDLEASSLPDKIHISQSTADQIKSLKLDLVERGVKVEGVEGKTYTINC